MTLRDVPFFNVVRNASREWLHDSTEFTLPQSVEWFQRESPPYLIILLDGVPIGYCRISNPHAPSDSGWGLSTERYIGIDLHPDYRGHGLAREAYDVLLATLRANGVRQFRLRVLKKNERAKHIYDTLGFRVVNETEDDVEMVLRAD